MQWQSLYEGLGNESFQEPSSIFGDMELNGPSTEQNPIFNPVFSINGMNSSSDSVPSSRLAELTPNVSTEEMFPIPAYLLWSLRLLLPIYIDLLPSLQRPVAISVPVTSA